MSANELPRKIRSTTIVDQCTMSNQQRTPARRAQQTSTRITLLGQAFENFTVVASALVAELRQTRPAQTRVPNTGMQVRVLPSALLCHAPVAQLVEAPALGAGQCGFESY